MWDGWVWWIITCFFGMYFVVLLLEFNRPLQKLTERIDSQVTRRQEMERRLTRVQEETKEMQSSMEGLQVTFDELEERRREILPDANAKSMVLIPAGPFSMGGRDEDSPRNEQPVHTVYMPSYYIDLFPVTNQDYQEFVQCTNKTSPIHWQRGTYPTGLGKHPVVNVSWQDARAYAAWMEARLPTEAEWEKAARGTDERYYPWGSHFVEEVKCNSGGTNGTTTAVDEYTEGRSPYGVWDMAGNVSEWCADYYEEEYYKTRPTNNPQGPQGGQERVIRGGDYQETRAGLRTTHRVGVNEVSSRDNIGFRIAMNAENAPSSSAPPPSSEAPPPSSEAPPPSSSAPPPSSEAPPPSSG